MHFQSLYKGRICVYSIWMHEMKDIPELRTALLDLHPGTRKEFF